MVATHRSSHTCRDRDDAQRISTREYGDADKVKEKLEEYLENKNAVVKEDKNQKEEEKVSKKADDTDLLMSAEEAYNE